MRRALGIAGALAAALTVGGTGLAHAQQEPVPLGPDCYKGLCLGQTEQEALATGLVVDETPGAPAEGCNILDFRPEEGQGHPGNGIFVHPEHGVVEIQGTDNMTTTEGVGFGQTLDQVRATYPDLYNVPPLDFTYAHDIPGNPGVRYIFAFKDDGYLSDFGLEDAAGMDAC
ncbi:hypothetical protein [Saccharopolyspora flava]|uniref:Peptidase inhibitor family I36 n=1 Tax=Saccharopolyspora flava TaxID=95161 RepID=A0A1I6QK15_9PSEU|nr:hypothetical protein [Saccharopolyspora flava]SFS52786.1 hypothetical protein SAMN05660874_01534 [Saccharopolyspora flava]